MIEDKEYSEIQLQFKFREGYQQGHGRALQDIQALVEAGYSLETALYKCWQHSENNLFPWRNSANEDPDAPAPSLKI